MERAGGLTAVVGAAIGASPENVTRITVRDGLMPLAGWNSAVARGGAGGAVPGPSADGGAGLKIWISCIELQAPISMPNTAVTIMKIMKIMKVVLHGTCRMA